MTIYDPDEATARADMCRFLSACYYEPAEEFAQEHLFDSMLTAATKISPDLIAPARQLRDAFAAQDLQTLLVDYTRLVLGPLEAIALPYSSAWLEAADAPADDNPPPSVLALYSEGGFDMDTEFMELPDHVAVELEFLYLLTFTENQATWAGQADEALATQKLKQRFLREHLGAWIGPFTSALAAGARTVFYRELAFLTERFVRMQVSTPVGRA
jgi:TorA maturation chaperone TorD